MNVEQEHHNVTHGSALLTGKIALAHLRESPAYYTYLARMERTMPKQIRSLPMRDPASEKAAYERREIMEFLNGLRRTEKLPLSERRENAARFAADLHRDPALIAQRVGWLLDGSYGYGSYVKAHQIAHSPRMNQGAWLLVTIANLEWGVPGKMTIQVWRTLTQKQRLHLDKLIKKEIKDAIEEGIV